MTAYHPGQGLPTGLPVALPLANTSNQTSAQVSAASGSLRGTNTPVTSSPEPRYGPARERHNARSLAQLADVMPARDWEVLQRVAEHRFLTTKQIQAFTFTTHETEPAAARTARRVVARLERLHLLRSLDRRIGGYGAGSHPAVWQITPPAARLLLDDGATYRISDPSPRFLAHCLAVADVHLGFRELAQLPHIHGVDVQTEPAAWRRYPGQGGELRWLQPDLAATIRAQDFTDRWFLEVDLGTESLPTLLKKCAVYEQYRATGIEQEQHGAFPLVLWLFTKQERADRLHRAIVRSPRLTPQLYRFAVPDTFIQTMRETLT